MHTLEKRFVLQNFEVLIAVSLGDFFLTTFAFLNLNRFTRKVFGNHKVGDDLVCWSPLIGTFDHVGIRAFCKFQNWEWRLVDKSFLWCLVLAILDSRFFFNLQKLVWNSFLLIPLPFSETDGFQVVISNLIGTFSWLNDDGILALDVVCDFFICATIFKNNVFSCNTVSMVTWWHLDFHRRKRSFKSLFFFIILFLIRNFLNKIRFNLIFIDIYHLWLRLLLQL